MTERQIAIIRLLREALSSGDEPADEIIMQLPDERLARKTFHSYRGDGLPSLRLSAFGFEALKKEFESYDVILQKDYRITAKDLLFLSRHCNMPYYIDFAEKKLWFFQKDIAVQAIATGGQINLLV